MALFASPPSSSSASGLTAPPLAGSLAAGVLWTTLLFAGVLGINRLFVAEREEGGFDAIRLAPIDRTALFAAKAAALLVYLLVLELIAVPDLRPLLPRTPRRPARRSSWSLPPRRSRPRRDRHADLLDGGQLPCPRPIGAAGAAAAGRAADDRRHRRHRAADDRAADPSITASAPGWRSSGYTI